MVNWTARGWGRSTAASTSGGRGEAPASPFTVPGRSPSPTPPAVTVTRASTRTPRTGARAAGAGTGAAGSASPPAGTPRRPIPLVWTSTATCSQGARSSGGTGRRSRLSSCGSWRVSSSTPTTLTVPSGSRLPTRYT